MNEHVGRSKQDGVELAYLEWTGESPPIVFLHGITATKQFWATRVALRGRQRALAYDARGHGDSARAASYRFVDFGQDAIAFLDGVCQEPAILVGHSLGALTAAFVAGKRPDLTRGACLIEPPLYVSSGLRDQRKDFEGRRSLAGLSIEELVAAGTPEVQALGLSRLDGRVLEQLLNGEAFEGWDTDEILAGITCPVLLEHGQRGIGSGIAASAVYDGEIVRASTLIRDCRVVEIKGSGHLPMIQQPEEFTRVVTNFIQSISEIP